MEESYPPVYFYSRLDDVVTIDEVYHIKLNKEIAFNMIFAVDWTAGELEINFEIHWRKKNKTNVKLVALFINDNVDSLTDQKIMSYDRGGGESVR